MAELNVAQLWSFQRSFVFNFVAPQTMSFFFFKLDYVPSMVAPVKDRPFWLAAPVTVIDIAFS